MLCPVRRNDDHSREEPNELELNSIRNDPDKLDSIRSRLSDVAWWMRLLCQNIGTRARLVRADKSGATPVDMAPIFERLKLDVGYWKLQIQEFVRLFSHMAGRPKDVYEMRSLISTRRFYLKRFKPEPAETA